MTLEGKNDQEKLDNLCKLNYKDQAIWFLNAFWHKFGEAEADNIWKYKHKHDELDDKHKEGCQLDELQAHRFLESQHETLTVSKLREKLQATGIDKNTKRKYIPLVHYLIIKYDADWHYLVTASQGDNQKEVEEAQRMLEQVQRAFEEVQRSAQAAKAREVESREAERAAVQKEAEAKEAQAAAKQAQIELEAALAELKAQEDAFNAKTEELKRKSEAGSVVQMNKAKNELAQHLASDPLPLRRAKITQEAAVKKAERAYKTAEEATRKSVEARAAAEEAVRKAEAAREEAEQAVEEARRKVEEAEAFVEEVKKKPGNAAGAIWWIDNELREARKYLPTSKGGVAKK